MIDWPTLVILGAVSLQRLAELIVADRNTRELRARGGVEHGAGQMPAMIAVHGAWLLGLWWFAWGRPVWWSALALYLAVQVLRVWVLATLGRRWTVRIITVPGETLVAKGPYRFIRHPNYAVVALEILLLPLVWGLWVFAALFTVANAVLLWWRIREESKALAPLR